MGLATNTPPVARLSGLRLLGGAALALTLEGATNGVYSTLASTNLSAPPSSWVEVLRVTNGAGRTTFTTPFSPAIPQRFYRARQE
jgi:hypothetical protein